MHQTAECASHQSASNNSANNAVSPNVRSAGISWQADHYQPNVDRNLVCTRQQLLSRLIRLSTALEHGHWDMSETMLHQFCETLLEYLSLGHERAFADNQPDTHLFAAIASTTRSGLAFYDRFYRGTGSLKIVRGALEQLALALETRFELEDDLFSQAIAA